MKVRDAIAVAQEWVDQEATHMPHFVGAHLAGSLATLPGDAPFPPYRDIDLAIVIADDRAEGVRDIAYRGCIVEYGLMAWRHYESAEVVLSDPGTAHELVANTILADPQGFLGPLHAVVAAQFTDRTWVRARCAAARQSVDAMRAVLDVADSAPATYGALLGLTGALAGWLAVAALRPPTHRRGLILQRDVLAQQDRLSLQEAALGLLGVERFDARRAQAYLAAAVAAFDRAVEVHRTPTPLDFKLHAYVRPYLVQGAQEMIDEGYPREAMPWIAAALRLGNLTVQLDGPSEEERQQVQATVDQLLEECGLYEPGALARRQQAAARLVTDMCEVVEHLLAADPAIRAA